MRSGLGRISLLLVGTLLIFIVYVFWPFIFAALTGTESVAEITTPPDVPIAHNRSASAPAQRVLEEAGIEIIGIGYSAAGYMLDFRYRVLDPEKAKRYITRQIKPVLKDTSSGAKLFAAAPPKLGTMRHTGNNLKKGKTYFVMFANPGRYIQPGSKVDIQIADIVIDGLTVVSGV